MIVPVRISGVSRNSVTVTPEQWYRALSPMLLRLAEHKFRVPEHASEDLLHDVFLSYLNRQPIANARGYLIGAMSNACRYYWRTGERIDREEELPERVFVPRYDTRIDRRRALFPQRERFFFFPAGILGQLDRARC